MEDTARVEQDLQWVYQARNHDQRAFARLVEHYQRPIYNMCYRMLGNPTEAEDAAQETFLRAYARLGTYDESHKFSTWLFSICSHYCIDCLRRRRFNWVDIDELSNLLPSRQRDDQPEQVVMQKESEARVQELLESLPTHYRAIVTLFYWQHMSYAEISQALNISEPTIKSRLFRARRALAESMQGKRPTDSTVWSGAALAETQLAA